MKWVIFALAIIVVLGIGVAWFAIFTLQHMSYHPGPFIHVTNNDSVVIEVKLRGYNKAYPELETPYQKILPGDMRSKGDIQERVWTRVTVRLVGGKVLKSIVVPPVKSRGNFEVVISKGHRVSANFANGSLK